MKYRVEKIGQSAAVVLPNGQRKKVAIGYVYDCKDKVDFDHKMNFESHHWKDITEYPEVEKPKPKPAPKNKAKKGGK